MNKNKLICVYLLTVSILLAASVNTFAQDKVMTNNEVLMLTKAGLNESIIINKIRASNTDFDLSTDELIRLKKEKVSDKIVNAMLEAKSGKPMTATTNVIKTGVGSGNSNDPMSPHGYGIYLFQKIDGKNKMTQLTPNVSAQNRTGGGFTAAITPLGLGKRKTKANLPGRNADMQIDESEPVFYFYLDASSGGLNTSSGIPSTPNEFALVRFNLRSDNREITIAKANAYSAKGGLSDEYVIEFDSQDLGNGIFKITPKSSLSNGEYAFYLLNSGNSNASMAIGSKFFDFGVKLTP